MSDEIKFEPFEIDLGDNGGVQAFTSPEDLISKVKVQLNFGKTLK